MHEKLQALDEPDAPPRVVRQCSLDKSTQGLIKLLFDHDMFNSAMQSLEIGMAAWPSLPPSHVSTHLCRH